MSYKLCLMSHDSWLFDIFLDDDFLRIIEYLSIRINRHANKAKAQLSSPDSSRNPVVTSSPTDVQKPEDETFPRHFPDNAKE